MIFNLGGVAIFGLIALNVFSAKRQHMPFSKVLSGLFVQIPTSSVSEKRLRLALIVFLLLTFLVLALDIQINGMQIVDPNWASRR